MEPNAAEEHLQVIRTLMERSAVYRRALGPIMLYLGSVGVLAAWGSVWFAVEAFRPFCLWWLGAAVVAVLSTLMVVTRSNLVHALLYLVISLFAVAVIFYTLGAPFVAALEVIVYAGAIMMLFLFAVMLLNVGADSPLRVPGWAWVAPGILVGVLLAEVIYGLTRQTQALAGAEARMDHVVRMPA
jgi:NADH:ubiquinone oxidoreductase subunit 6 (subunit J)